ncbi:uncharacterized protein LOC132300554 isoform X2 [Cornus florida]|uniref:uncharacterized protein LOC132300554 isoform X2 n=1 Tax=Cornus florida TaxID=4283 RepID=UPI0028964F5B|nr:uncharacterized protein LOC132300554 isoform X2 [Cornus florida]
MSSLGDRYAMLLTQHLTHDAEEIGRPHQSQVLRDYVTRQINVFLWISLITITLLLLRKLAKLFGLWAKGSLIPGPPCPSFYGHSNLISGASLTDLLSKSHEKYGPVIKLWLGPTQLLVSMTDPELIKEMLLKAVDKFPLTGRAFRLAFGQSSLFVSSFDKVQKRRDSLERQLNGKLLERANIIPAKVADCVMERIQDIMAKGNFDCKIISQHLAFTILGASLFGDTFLSWSKATVYEDLLMMIAKDACFWASYSVTPFWKRGFWRYQYLCTKLKCLTQDIIQQCRQNYELFTQVDQIPRNVGREAASGAPPSSVNAMPNNLFLQQLDDHPDTGESCGNITSVMFHGCLTTAGLIGNMLARLVAHPELQDKIYSEIVMVRNESKQQDQQAVDQMLLLLATVYESARLLPAGPLLQRCSLNHDLNLKTGVTIPAGAMLVVPIQLVQTDNSSWGADAGQFNPFRFLSKAKNGLTLSTEEQMDGARSSYVLNEPNESSAFLPFGSGTRACIGQKFAILGVAKLFASLLEHYEV